MAIRIAREDPLIALESDKATMEVPSDATGVVTDIRVAVGDTLSQGDIILTLEINVQSVSASPSDQPPTATAKPESDSDTPARQNKTRSGQGPIESFRGRRPDCDIG